MFTDKMCFLVKYLKIMGTFLDQLFLHLLGDCLLGIPGDFSYKQDYIKIRVLLEILYTEEG